MCRTRGSRFCSSFPSGQQLVMRYAMTLRVAITPVIQTSTLVIKPGWYQKTSGRRAQELVPQQASMHDFFVCPALYRSFRFQAMFSRSDGILVSSGSSRIPPGTACSFHHSIWTIKKKRDLPICSASTRHLCCMPQASSLARSILSAQLWCGSSATWTSVSSYIITIFHDQF